MVLNPHLPEHLPQPESRREPPRENLIQDTFHHPRVCLSHNLQWLQNFPSASKNIRQELSKRAKPVSKFTRFSSPPEKRPKSLRPLLNCISPSLTSTTS